MGKPVLYYVYDPMCSWCWGYRNSWLKLSNALSQTLPEQVLTRYQLGGLAPDSDTEMPQQMQQMLQGVWHKINEQLGTEFNFAFWTECIPQRSTYPACRACLIAREFDKEKEMLFAIQQAYYLQARNPSLTSTLLALAEEVGLDKVIFERQLGDDQLNSALLNEIKFSHQLPIRGFPSLVLQINKKKIAIDIDYGDWQKTYEDIIQIIKSNDKN